MTQHLPKYLALGIIVLLLVAIIGAIVYRGSSYSQRPARDQTPTSTSVASPTGTLSFSTYVNVRFAYSVCYPPSTLVPQGESANNDGQRFVSADGQAVAMAYGSNNSLGQTLEQVLVQDDQTSVGTPITISRKSIDPNGFTFDGSSGNTIFAEKTLFVNQQFKTLNIQYPAAASATYAPIVQQMTNCFSNTSPTEYSNPK